MQKKNIDPSFYFTKALAKIIFNLEKTITFLIYCEITKTSSITIFVPSYSSFS